MKNTTKRIYDELIIKNPALFVCKDEILNAFELVKQTYLDGGKILVCGNGGSAADSEHIVGELMKNFKKCRKADEELLSKLVCDAPEAILWLSNLGVEFDKEEEL